MTITSSTEKPTLKLKTYQRISDPHHIVLTVFMEAKYGIRTPQPFPIASRYARILNEDIGYRKRFSMDDASKLKPLDVIAFVNMQERLAYQVIVTRVDQDSGKAVVAELKHPFGIQFSDLSKVVLDDRNSLIPYLVKAAEIESIIKRMNLPRR